MNYVEIHEALKKNGYSWALVASALNCSDSNVMHIAARRGNSVRVARAISAMIGKDVLEVFPDKPFYKNDKAAEREKKLDQAMAQIDQALAS